VVAGLERNIHGTSDGVRTGISNGFDFSMCRARSAVVTLTHHVAIAYEYGAHSRIWPGLSLSQPSQLQRSMHMPFVHADHTFGRSKRGGEAIRRPPFEMQTSPNKKPCS